MIKVLRKDRQKDDTDTFYYQIQERKNFFRLFFRNGEIEKEVLFNKKETAGKIYDILIVEGREKTDVLLDEKYTYISRSEPKDSYVRAGQKLGRVFFGKIDTIFALTYPCEEVKNCENIVLTDEEESMTGSFRRISEEYKEYTDKAFSKYDMIDHVDIYNSITYLESQVDALTKIALKLYKENDILSSILKEADKYNVLDIKDKDNIILEINQDKKNIRDLQEKYYAKK